MHQWPQTLQAHHKNISPPYLRAFRLSWPPLCLTLVRLRFCWMDRFISFWTDQVVGPRYASDRCSHLRRARATALKYTFVLTSLRSTSKRHHTDGRSRSKCQTRIAEYYVVGGDSLSNAAFACSSLAAARVLAASNSEVTHRLVSTSSPVIII